MKFRVIETIFSVAARTLFKELQGRMFHVTSPEAFVKICASGAILSNTNGRFRCNWTDNYYFKKIGCLSVVDLVNNTRHRVTKRKLLNDYKVFEQASPVVVFMFLSPKVHARAITWHRYKKEKAYGLQIVPELESGIPEKISLGEIDEVWFITLKDRVALQEQISNLAIAVTLNNSDERDRPQEALVSALHDFAAAATSHVKR